MNTYIGWKWWVPITRNLIAPPNTALELKQSLWARPKSISPATHIARGAEIHTRSLPTLKCSHSPGYHAQVTPPYIWDLLY
jgi:hypothetical protein